MSQIKELKITVQIVFVFYPILFFPNGDFGGGLGSRSTVHLYPYAFVYWSKYSEIATTMLSHFFEKKFFQANLAPKIKTIIIYFIDLTST